MARPISVPRFSAHTSETVFGTIMERAIALLGNPPIEMEWKPFQLNPTMPREGMDRREYRTRKFGSWEQSRVLDAQARAAGAEVGIAFAHDKIVRTPNTVASHRRRTLRGALALSPGVFTLKATKLYRFGALGNFSRISPRRRGAFAKLLCVRAPYFSPPPFIANLTLSPLVPSNLKSFPADL
jgi:hypothetical protein